MGDARAGRTKQVVLTHFLAALYHYYILKCILKHLNGNKVLRANTLTQNILKREILSRFYRKA